MTAARPLVVPGGTDPPSRGAWPRATVGAIGWAVDDTIGVNCRRCSAVATSGSEEDEQDGRRSHRDTDDGESKQEAFTGARFPALPQRGLQLSVVHDPVQHGRQSGARQGSSKRDIRPVRAADDLGQDTPDSESGGNPCQTSTPPREIGALVRERRPVDLAACHSGDRARRVPEPALEALAAAGAPRSDCRSAGGHRHATLPIFGRPGTGGCGLPAGRLVTGTGSSPGTVARRAMPRPHLQPVAARSPSGQRLRCTAMAKACRALAPTTGASWLGRVGQR